MPGSYPTKVKVSKEQMEQVRLHPHEFHGEWNYTIEPAAIKRRQKEIVKVIFVPSP